MAWTTQQWNLIREQDDVVTRTQLRDFGWSDRQVDLQTGRLLHRVHRGVFAVGTATLTARGRWMAAVLACGRGAALSHESAAALWKVIPRDFATHVSLPPGRQAAHEGITIHRRGFVLDRRYVGKLCATSPLETLVDLAATRSPGQIARLVDAGDRLNLITADHAAVRLASMRRRAGAHELAAVLLGRDETDSDLEVDFLALIERARLPKPKTQAELLGFRVDFFWRDLRLVVETDGLTYHRTRAQQARDRKRDQRLTAAGYTCLRFTEHQVRREEAAVGRILRRVRLRRAGPRCLDRQPGAIARRLV